MSRHVPLLLLLLVLPLWLAASYGVRFALMEDGQWVGICVEQAARWECQARAGLGYLIHFRVIAWTALVLAVLGFIEREALEMAVVALAQTRVVRWGQCVSARDCGGSLPRAREIAAVQGGKMQACACEAARGGLCLAQPGFVEGDVDMPLQPALGVPGGFAVANQANPA